MQQLFSSIILIVCLLAYNQSGANGSPPNILILGDSLSAAYNIPVEQSWPNLFTSNIRADYPGTSVTNASISGETTFGGLQRLPALLERIKPTHLIIELGGNDGLRGYKFKQTTDNLDNMIGLTLQQNIEVLLVGVELPPNLGAAYTQRFRDIFSTLAEQHQITLLPHFLEGVAASNPEFMQADGIHPTAIAQPVLADKIFKIMLEIIAADQAANGKATTNQ